MIEVDQYFYTLLSNVPLENILSVISAILLYIFGRHRLYSNRSDMNSEINSRILNRYSYSISDAENTESPAPFRQNHLKGEVWFDISGVIITTTDSEIIRKIKNTQLRHNHLLKLEF